MKDFCCKILFSILFCALFACESLNMPPLNMVVDDDIFKNEAGINAYMARLYGELPIEDFHFTVAGFYTGGATNPYIGVWSEELVRNIEGYHVQPNGNQLHWWGYESVRNVNYFLEKISDYSSNFTLEQLNAFLGEAYFIRAYYYFAMVKRYGGIPIIDKVQNYPGQTLEELKVKRNSEQEVYNFIEKDLDEAIRLLPEKSLQLGRANKGVAYALKSRAMLYAASIAKYGTLQLGGILGIPSQEASRYFNSSLNASLEVAKRYSLYNKYTDKAENYWHLFLDKDSPETIFAKYYYYPNFCHSFDAFNIPFQMRGASGYGSLMSPTLEIVELFGEMDGSFDGLKIENNGEPIRFDNTMDLFVNVEPRLKGSVILPGDVFKGEVIDIQKGLYTSYPNGELLTSTDWTKTYSGDKGEVHITGKSGIGNSESSVTGFHLRKYQNPDMPHGILVMDRSEQSWIDMRYGEILLNQAEAAFELGKKDLALDALNAIRERAGAKLYSLNDISIDVIRRERRLELCFENHSYWDLRRWRTAALEINNKQYTALCPYYIYDEGKYIFKKEGVGSFFTFDPKVYYLMIPNAEITKNDLLEQNPGY